MKQKIIISDRDERRIRSLLDTRRSANAAEAENLQRLAGELDRARILPPEEMPASIEKPAKLPAMIVQKNNAIRLREEISLSPLFVSTVLNRLSAYRYSGS